MLEVVLVSPLFLLPFIPKVLFHNTGPDDCRKKQTSQNFDSNLYLCVYIDAVIMVQV